MPEIKKYDYILRKFHFDGDGDITNIEEKNLLSKDFSSVDAFFKAVHDLENDGWKIQYRGKIIDCVGCGKEVDVTNSWANECVCGIEYNGSGQQLADRSQWGEETGENFN